ncbi:5-formyltetrahydrofolate cyclo-ligase [Jiangella alkaliphila]|uniref:5-formyltetrahydrofolate cyclo-ligase n=1 Tax=Jiangella alkaliphila TaxID=419479 RepID=A0A1H2GEF3_9ACTN|nr:5-formyltetrahydrofolate cyclo-ligase [Jiangella alkaliphila]SDU17801.1 5-formyltetrahydrofolate cyclo-ligase [Jiangella alkaliphila]
MTAAKNAVRDEVWRSLLAAGVVPLDSYGKIPAYDGADRAADRLATLQEWQRAETVKANPDRAQFDVRLRALRDGKRLYMAVPRMAAKQPFILLEPALIDSIEDAAAKDGAVRHGRPVDVDAIEQIDIVVAGSVAVDRNGTRIGKGAGYSDLEMALLTEAGLITYQTMIVTLVHHLQITTEPIPESDHDFPVDYVITPSEIISCPRRRRPTGVMWDHLTTERIDAIPALRRAHRTGRKPDL